VKRTLKYLRKVGVLGRLFGFWGQIPLMGDYLSVW